MARKVSPETRSPAANLILEHIGPGRMFKDQADFRVAAGIGASSLGLLRNDPASLSDAAIIKFCEAVEIDPALFFIEIGRPLPSKTVTRANQAENVKRQSVAEENLKVRRITVY